MVQKSQDDNDEEMHDATSQKKERKFVYTGSSIRTIE
jgi:hypothetical protein